MGYSEKQIKELEETINKVPVDLVIIGTPIDLTRIIKFRVPTLRVKYELNERGKLTLKVVLQKYI